MRLRASAAHDELRGWDFCQIKLVLSDPVAFLIFEPLEEGNRMKKRLVLSLLLLLLTLSACGDDNDNGSPNTPTGTPTILVTDTPTLAPTGTPTATPTARPTDTQTQVPTDTPAPTETPANIECPVVVADADCDRSQRPFVFVHGTFGSGDNFAHVARLLGSNGFCQDRIIAIDYNSLGEMPGTNGQLDAAIDAVLAATGFTQVDLAGHSQGTAHCGAYLSDPAHAAKVAHYINFSGSPT